MNENGTVVAGIDTHKDVHVLCLLDGFGRKTFSGSFPADAKGYNELAAAIGDPSQCIVVGIEGTSTYGAGLTRRLEELGYDVVEVLRPKRKRRPGQNKNDVADAERAARDAIAGNGAGVPKSKDGWVEQVRYLTAARSIAVKTSTACSNSAQGLLGSAPEEIRSKFAKMDTEAMMVALTRKRQGKDPIEAALYASLRILAGMWVEAKRNAKSLEIQIEKIMQENAPALLEINGCGALCAAELAIAAGDNPDRMGSDAAFAALCGTSPVEASSGKVIRHRLNRGGNRRANCALYRIATARMRDDERTKAYVEKKTAEGKSKKEIKRCLKRYIAREVYKALLNPTESRLPEPPDGSELKKLRKSLGLTQADVAKMLLTTATNIGSIERGVRRIPALENSYCECLAKLHKNSLPSA